MMYDNSAAHLCCRTTGHLRAGLMHSPKAGGSRRISMRDSMTVVLACVLLIVAVYGLGQLANGYKSGPSSLWLFSAIPCDELLSPIISLVSGRRHRKRMGLHRLNSLVSTESETDDDDELLASLAGNTGARLAVVVITGSNQAYRMAVARDTWVKALDPQTDAMLFFSDAISGDMTRFASATIALPGTGATWEGAQTRWLPAVNHLRLSYPQAEWLMIMDDDTFLCPKGLKAMLTRYNARNKLYIGRAMWVSPDKGQGSRLKVPFAHGGSGVVISKGLAKALAPHLERHLSTGECSTTGLGDGDLGVCIKDKVSVDVTHEACLHAEHPEVYAEKDDKFHADLKQPCTFHYAFKNGTAKEVVNGLSRMRRWHELYNERNG